ncbi:hypothetical protein LIER_02778 [Lithospermum erythrorhizon]|uniref:Uncharacterized protein n=1 Tax=Lithospermum erythrorhizon TaxID=34254 RepID=A0AAV3NR57_LITER
MKDLNVDCNGNGWHLFYGENNLENRQYYTTFIQRNVSDSHTGHDRNGLKQKMLEHDAIFKNQVYELHRLYRTQRDMTEDIKTKEGHRHGDSIEPSSSPSPQRFQAQSKWHISSYPVVGCGRPAVLGTENVTSPLSCSNGNGILSSLVRLQNDYSKDLEVTEARPLKVRKKLIDLQLPADEFSDTEDAEQLDSRRFDRSSFTPNQECSGRLENCVKLSNGDFVREKMDILQGECNSVSNTRISIGLADLNEPAEVEEATESSIKIFGQFASNSAVKGIELSAKHNSGFPDLPRDAMQKPGHVRNDSLNNFLTGNNVNGSKWLPFSCEAEHAGRSHNLVPKSVQQDKLSLHATPLKVLSQDHHPGFHFADHRQESSGKERMTWGLEGFHKSQDYASHTYGESSNSDMFLGSHGVAHTRPHIMSPWGKAADSSSPKLTSLHSQNLSKGLIKTLQSSVVSKDILGHKWYVNNSSHSSPVLTRNPPSYNGCYHASSSSKDSTGFRFDPLNCSRGDNIASSLPVNHGMEKACMTPSCIDIKPLKDLNLNETFPGNALNEAVPYQDLGIMYGKNKHENHKPSFPWLREKSAANSEAANPEIEVISISSSPPRASQVSLFGKGGTGQDLNCVYNATSSTNLRTWPKNERYETKCVKGILGGSIFKKLGASENKASSLASSAPERENAKQEKKNFLLDINVAWDASLLECSDGSDVEEVVTKKQLGQSCSVRKFIDLNSCVTEDEDFPIPYGGSSNAPVKFVADFDLEAPAVAEEDILPEKEKEQNILPPSQHCESEQLDDEVLMCAAEAIVDMYSCQDKAQGENIISLPGDVELESLLWFADVVSTVDKMENSSGKECSYKEMDDFEAMTLLLPDTKEEDYMHKPFIPEVQVEEAGGAFPPTRPRRGQARRGRQRRDFQRDILPGLVTLTRHEMTEDLQTFGGLMRATGHAWNSGSTRRNGGTRGRRRKAVELAHDSASVGGCTQQMNNEGNSLEDRRSLTGWGKTTRRPRRQRCPPNNEPTAALT